MITTRQARSLAVIYCAFTEAYQKGDHCGVLVWGRMLDDIQQETEVVMVANVRPMIEIARKKMSKAA